MKDTYKVCIRLPERNLFEVHLWFDDLNVNLLGAIHFFLPELGESQWTHIVRAARNYRGTGSATGSHAVFPSGKDIWIEKGF